MKKTVEEKTAISYYKKKQEEEILRTKFTRTSTNREGVTSVWTYDLDKFANGPISVELIYPASFKLPEEKLMMENKDKPRSEQKFLNPNNGKLVGYYRAKTLGII